LLQRQIHIQLTFVATLTIKGDNKDLKDCFAKLKTKANLMGANCYSIMSYNAAVEEMKMSIYNASYAILSKNYANHPQNVIYIFGGEKVSDEKFSFKINGEKKKIYSGTYYQFENSNSEDVSINKGGFLGSTVTVRYKSEFSIRLFTTSGFGVGGDTFGGQVGISFNTGRISIVEDEFGFFLTKVLKKSDVEN
jgi:hypothetical protein